MGADGGNRDSFSQHCGEIKMTRLFIYLSRLRGLFTKRKLEDQLTVRRALETEAARLAARPR